jgi:hypothetical protein
MRHLRILLAVVLGICVLASGPVRAVGANPWTLLAYTAAGTISAGAAVTTPAIVTTGANLLVAVVTNHAATTATISDSDGNSWTATTKRSNTAGGVQVFYVPAAVTTSGADTFTIAAVANNLAAVTFMAFSGADASPFDTEGGGTTLNTATITPASDYELVVAGYVDSIASADLGTNNLYGTTAFFPVVGATRYAHQSAIKFPAVAAATFCSFINGGLGNPATTIVAFKGNGSGSGGGASAYPFIQ